MSTAEKATAKTPRESAYHVLKKIAAAVNGSPSASIAASSIEQYELVARDVQATRAKNAVEKHCALNKDATDLPGTYYAILASDWPGEAFPVQATREIVVTIGGTA